MTRPNGEVVWSAVYDAQGRITELPVDQVAQPLRLQGQYFDPEIDLCYNRHRHFDPRICSFISQDPIGLAGGENVYVFAPNVWNWVDPLGLCTEASKSGQIVDGGYEYFYRSMYKAEYEQFIKTGKLPATRSEKMISPTQHFSEAYEGVLVKFQMQPGSTDALYDAAVSVGNNATKKQFPSLKLGGKWMDNGTLLKIEKGQLRSHAKITSAFPPSEKITFSLHYAISGWH